MGIEARSDVYSFESNLSGLSQPTTGSSHFAFFGPAAKGPIDEWYFFTDIDVFFSIFGEPNSQYGFAHYDIVEAMNEGASGFWFRRVAAPNATFGGVLIQNKNPGSGRVLTITNTGITSPLSTLNTALTTLGTPADANDNVLLIMGIGPGADTANIAVEIVSPNLKTPAIASVAQIDVPLGSTRVSKFVDGTIYNYYVTSFNKFGETAHSPVGSATFAVASGATDVIAVNLTTPVDPGAMGRRVYRVTGASPNINNAVLVGTMGPSDTQFLDYNDGTYAAAVPPIASTIAARAHFTLNVYDNRISTVVPQESFECSLQGYQTASGSQTLIEEVVNSRPGGFNGSKYIRVFNSGSYITPLPTITSLPKTVLQTGTSGSAVSSSDMIAPLAQLTDKDKYNIAGISDGGFTTLSVQKAVIQTIRQRGRGVALINVPSNQQQAQDAINFARVTLGESGDRIVVTTPDHRIQDRFTKRQLFVPSSGKMAGLLGFTDRIKNPGWSPAGRQRGIVSNTIELRHNYNNAEKNTLADANVNYFATERLYGTVLQECYTLTSDFSALSFIPVRRILDVGEEAAEQVLRYYLHEPNTDLLGMLMVSRLRDLYSLMKSAQMIGEYEVVDKTTPQQMAQGNRYIYSLISPLIPTVRIAHTTIITREGVSFDTIIQSIGA